VRFLVAVLLFAASTSSFAEETLPEFAKRVSQHVQTLSYDPGLKQAARRHDLRTVRIGFQVAADGSITEVKVLRTSVSSELTAKIVRTFGNFPGSPTYPGRL
jgi:outer membrane biosynthesis protein TonB